MKRRGRPVFKATPARRRIVQEMLACGERQDIIAAAIGCDRDTLRKHFARDLDIGRAERRREIIQLLFRSARKGNVAAQKRLDDMTRIAGAEERLGATPERPRQIGKKEQAKEAAEAAATGKYETPPAPRLVVDNR